MSAQRRLSLRRYLLIGILLPIGVYVVLNTMALYRQSLEAVHTAYDRTLLASAKSIGEQLTVEGYDKHAVLRATVPYAALEAFETDSRSHMFYRVSTEGGALISGFEDLPAWRGKLPASSPYAALVHFYDDEFRHRPVRVAVLLQPVASERGRGMAVIQVAETLELRQELARQILVATLLRQLALVAVIAFVVVVVVQRATRPVRQLSADLQARAEGDLTPIAAPHALRELQPLVEATNQVMERLSRLLAHQQRFVRDASHQLRTPLAVLKTQVQSAQRGDLPPAQALHEIGTTVQRATQLANQMLALAKVDQLRQQGEPPVSRLDEVLREVALDLSPLIAQGDLDFGISTQAAPIRAHAWMLRELCRNLLHNAIRHAPPHTELSVTLQAQDGAALLTIADAGAGIDDELATRLFQPFSAGDVRQGSGLGLAICHEIVQALGGSIVLTNRRQGARVQGLDAVVRLPLSTTASEAKSDR